MSIVLTALFALAAPPQTGAQILYTPVRSALDQKITVKGWGSGSGGETDEAVYEGAHSIRVSTRNYFQGANIDFGDPKDLSDRYSDRNNLLKVVLKTADDGTAVGGSGAPGKGGPGSMGGPAGMGGSAGMGGPGGMGAPGGLGGRGGAGGPGGFGGGRGGAGAGGPGGFAGGQGGLGGPGGRPGQGGPGGRPGMGGMSGGMGGSSAAPTFTTVRMIVTTTDGKKSEAYLPIATSSSGERGWKTVAIPLQAISGFDRTNKTIKDIAFSGDTTTTFYVGELRVVNDPTAIRGEILGQRTPYNLALGDKVTLSARGEGGSSVLEYVWDFDDADGTDDVDAIGQTVVHQFRRASAEGKMTKVTLTVRDKYGLKPPFKTSIEVHVNP